MRELKVMSLAAVLMMTVLCVASVGVTESWWSDTDDVVINIDTPVSIELVPGDGVTVDGMEAIFGSSGQVVSFNIEINGNYSVSIYCGSTLVGTIGSTGSIAYTSTAPESVQFSYTVSSGGTGT